jgi:glycosyltransferase involved in cell wall biosynthesis
MAIKTLHITNSYHAASGGIRTFYHALLEAANRHRRYVRLVVPGPETSVEEVGEFGRIYHVAAPHVPVIDSRYRWMLPHVYAWPYDSPLRRILAAERPDLVEVCDKFWLLYLSGALRRQWIPGVPVPVIVGLTCERLDDNMRTYVSAGWAAQRACESYMRKCYVPRFDFHLAASDYIATEVRRLLPERLRDRLRVCPMGVDYEAFGGPRDGKATRQELLRRSGGSENTVLLLYAGRLSKEKNLSMLPEVLARLAERPRNELPQNHQTQDRDLGHAARIEGHARLEYRLIIAGGGPFSDELRDSLEEFAPGRSVFLGHCQREELRTLYHAADIFLHPNPREPFGIAPLEAMAAGLPLVAPASGGVLTYANSGNAWLAENTVEAFAVAIENVHADGEIYERKIASARRTAEEFSWTRVTANYFQLYDQFHEWFVREGLRNKPGRQAFVRDGNTQEIGSLEAH